MPLPIDAERQATRTWANPSWWHLLVVLSWAMGTSLLINQWRVDRDIAARERTVQGVINAHEPANHNRYGYVFSVRGKSFSGWQSPGKEGLEIGKQVLVYYDPIDPDKNATHRISRLGHKCSRPCPADVIWNWGGGLVHPGSASQRVQSGQIEQPPRGSTADP
jgi:hypothetical protein